MVTMVAIDISAGGKVPLIREFSIRLPGGKTRKVEFQCFTAFTTKPEIEAATKDARMMELMVRTVKKDAKYFLYIYGGM